MSQYKLVDGLFLSGFGRLRTINNWQQEMQRLFPHTEFNADMRQHTYFRIGGRADALFEPRNAEELSGVLNWADDLSIPWLVIGNGTNLLVSDLGIRGIVIKIGSQMSAIRQDGDNLRIEAGALLVNCARYALKASLTGMEFSYGIPGTIGGAVFMNAGAYGGEMKDIVIGADILLDGEMRSLSAAELGLSYRKSVIEEMDAVIVDVTLGLNPGNPVEIEETMNRLNSWRKERQPLEMPSAGSTFKRPENIAGSLLIDQAGLKGLRIGGAEVSPKHAGFIVNCGGATAADVLALMAEVQKEVAKKSGVVLQPEVRFLGEDMPGTEIFSDFKVGK